MQTKTLNERIEELNKIKKSYEFEPTNNEFFKAMKVIEELQEENETLQELNAISYDANARLSKENEALLAKNKELEEELQERKAYIVANPCAQCGGRINAIKCDAWAKKAKELEGKVEIAKDYIDRALLKSREHRSENAVDILENALIKLNKQGE